MKSQLRWAGSVVRMKDYRLPKKLFNSELSQGKLSQGGQKKALQSHTEGLYEVYQYRPELPGISDAGQRQVAWSCQTKSESL